MEDSFLVCSLEETVQFFLDMEIAEVQQAIGKLTPEKISLVVSALHPDKDPSWQQKIRAVFQGLAQRDQLEACGKSLSPSQFLEILNVATELESIHHWKLLPILVGVHSVIFEIAFEKGSDSQLLILKQEGITEPIQHHLTFLLHEWAKEIEGYSTSLHSVLKEISTFDVEHVTTTSLQAIQETLLSFSQSYQRMIQKISRALALAWNTNRSDLIEKMTALKDSCMKYKVTVIGHPRSSDESATGFYALLDNRLKTIYEGQEGAKSAEDLEEDDLSSEGLAKLGIWYLEDYWELGLLPGIKEAEVMQQEDEPALDPTHSREREELYALALSNLQHLGLSTVKDLKEANIYSKEMLQKFITHHKKHLKKTLLK